MPEQVQDFYPTPSTLSTVMYYTGIDPITGDKVYVCRNPHEKNMQRALIQYKNPKNHDLIREALLKAGREDLIGFGEKCLIRPGKREGDSVGKKEIRSKDNKKDNRSKTRFDRVGQKKNKVIRNIHQKKT